MLSTNVSFLSLTVKFSQNITFTATEIHNIAQVSIFRIFINLEIK